MDLQGIESEGKIAQSAKLCFLSTKIMEFPLVMQICKQLQTRLYLTLIYEIKRKKPHFEPP